MAHALHAGMRDALHGKRSAKSPGSSNLHVAGLDCIQITSLLSV